MFGSHLSIAGGLHNALLAAEKLCLDTVQIFTANPRNFGQKPEKELHCVKERVFTKNYPFRQ